MQRILLVGLLFTVSFLHAAREAHREMRITIVRTSAEYEEAQEKLTKALFTGYNDISQKKLLKVQKLCDQLSSTEIRKLFEHETHFGSLKDGAMRHGNDKPRISTFILTYGTEQYVPCEPKAKKDCTIL